LALRTGDGPLRNGWKFALIEVFAQVEEAGGRSQGGLGIGLAMVHKLVEMHGGSVEARSDGVGRGREFIVRLPLGSLGVYDGDEALHRIRELRPDAVVLDFGMPGMDGYAVARAIRADAANEGMRLIALTGWGQEGDRERTRDCGCDHLTKPVDLAGLQRLLAEDVRAGQPTN
jgi:CheY-like chemotaxis protein